MWTERGHSESQEGKNLHCVWVLSQPCVVISQPGVGVSQLCVGVSPVWL